MKQKEGLRFAKGVVLVILRVIVIVIVLVVMLPIALMIAAAIVRAGASELHPITVGGFFARACFFGELVVITMIVFLCMSIDHTCALFRLSRRTKDITGAAMGCRVCCRG